VRSRGRSGCRQCGSRGRFVRGSCLTRRLGGGVFDRLRRLGDNLPGGLSSFAESARRGRRNGGRRPNHRAKQPRRDRVRGQAGSRSREMSSFAEHCVDQSRFSAFSASTLFWSPLERKCPQNAAYL
jgi:hypothetical protein